MPFHPTQTDIELSPASQASFAIDRLHRLSGDLLLSHILPLTLVERTWLMLPLNAVCFEAPIGKRNGDARSLTRGAAFKTERFESHLGAKWKRRNRANGDTPRSCQSVTPSAPSACAGDSAMARGREPTYRCAATLRLPRCAPSASTTGAPAHLSAPLPRAVGLWKFGRLTYQKSKLTGK